MYLHTHPSLHALFLYQESHSFHADPSFFSIFSFALLEGDRATALVEPNSIVITESIASRYFPGGGALGQMLRFNNGRDYRVTGIMEDIPALVSSRTCPFHLLQLGIA